MSTPPRVQPYPWRVEDLLRWYAGLGASIVGTTVAWWGVSGTLDLARAITWLDVAVLALVASGLGNARWLLQGRRAVAARQRDLLPAAVEATSAVLRPKAHDERRVAVPGTTRHHRRDCPAVAGKPVQDLLVSDHEHAGRTPCGLCPG